MKYILCLKLDNTFSDSNTYLNPLGAPMSALESLGAFFLLLLIFFFSLLLRAVGAEGEGMER